MGVLPVTYRFRMVYPCPSKVPLYALPVPFPMGVHASSPKSMSLHSTALKLVPSDTPAFTCWASHASSLPLVIWYTPSTAAGSLMSPAPSQADLAVMGMVTLRVPFSLTPVRSTVPLCLP